MRLVWLSGLLSVFVVFDIDIVVTVDLVVIVLHDFQRVEYDSLSEINRRALYSDHSL